MSPDPARVSEGSNQSETGPWSVMASCCQDCSTYPCKIHPYLGTDTLDQLSKYTTTHYLTADSSNGDVAVTKFAGSIAVLATGHGMTEHHSPDGTRTVLNFFHAGDVVYFENSSHNEEAVQTQGKLLFRPLHAVRLCLIPSSIICSTAELRGVLNLACAELATSQTQQIILGKMPAYQRLAYFLFKEVRRTALSNGGQETKDNAKGPFALHLPMVRADIADYLGINLETVSRCFTRLRKEKLISLPKPNTVVIPDPGALHDVFASAV